MEGADQILVTISKLMDMGMPVAMLVVIVWLTIKYLPGLISTFKGLGDSMTKNTAATMDLKSAFDNQVDKMALVTFQLQNVVDNLNKVEAQQVKLPAFDKMSGIINEILYKVNSLYDGMDKS